jgi:opacity protein-like surface antigen
MNYRYDQGQTVLAKKDSAMRGGYEYGLGFGYKVTDCFVLGLEASRTNYKKYSFTQGPRANDDNDGYTKHYTHNPRLEQVELKFTYQF